MNKQQLYIHVPAQLVPSRLTFLLNRHLQPEIACQDVAIERLDFELLGDCAAQLKQQGLTTTLHAPFYGFQPGSRKKRQRKKSHVLADQSLQLAAKINARRIVFHPGLDYGSSAAEQNGWLESNLEFWPPYLERARDMDCLICIENIYESQPEIFLQLLQGLGSPQLGHVFDIGHWNIFGGISLEAWLSVMAPYLHHLHLHDNHGERDEHLAAGQGTVPFSALFEWLKTSTANPTFTIENRSLPQTEESLRFIAQTLTE